MSLLYCFILLWSLASVEAVDIWNIYSSSQVDPIYICVPCGDNLVALCEQRIYCKSTNFGMLLYLANLANCVFSLIFVVPKYVIVR